MVVVLVVDRLTVDGEGTWASPVRQAMGKVVSPKQLNLQRIINFFLKI